MRPGIVHRIDMDTTGSLLVCKNDRAHQILAEQLKDHSITRRYEAIVHGNLKEDSGTVNAPIGRHPTDRKKMSVHAPHGREAVTHYRVLERFGNYTHIECELETGRTHQIRVHMASVKHRTSDIGRLGLRTDEVSVQTAGTDAACRDPWLCTPFYGSVCAV